MIRCSVCVESVLKMNPSPSIMSVSVSPQCQQIPGTDRGASRALRLPNDLQDSEEGRNHEESRQKERKTMVKRFQIQLP